MESGSVTPWRKSTYSGTSGDSCVETRSLSAAVEVRDTTDRGGFALTVPATAWSNFTTRLKVS